MSERPVRIRDAVRLLICAGLGLIFAGVAEAQQMAIPGKFNVNQNGAAIHSIPITVPPGTAGMAPALSLDYSSQNGDGIVGIGWLLSGLPSIGRCPQTTAQDGAVVGVSYSTTDRFCIDGQRLIATTGSYGAIGTVYRTELEGFSEYISHGLSDGELYNGGPAWFEAHTKAGQEMDFGNTTDSAILPQGTTTKPVRAWAVNQITDTKGNYIKISYSSNLSGLSYPTEIDYTGNATTVPAQATYNSVKFVYNTSRPDTSLVYLAGSMIENTVLLTDIQTYQGANLVFDYKLTYARGTATNRSRLTSIQQCDPSNTCLPATTFGWTDSGSGSNPITFAMTEGGTYFPGTVIPGNQIVTGDFNGDGFADFGYFYTYGSTTFYWYRSNGDGTFTANTVIGMPATYGGESLTYVFPPLAGDFYGNGRTDVAAPAYYAVCIEESRGCLEYAYYFVPYVLTANANNTFSGAQVSFGSSFFATPNGCFGSVQGDLNGDGRADVAAFNTGIAVYSCLSNGSGGFTVGTSTATGLIGTAISGDFNGDGKTDVAIVKSTSVTTYLSSGSGAFTAQTAQTLTIPTTETLIVGDFLGDGLTDFAYIGTSTINVYLSKGDGTFSALPQQTVATIPSGLAAVAGNFTGDGRTDFVMGSTSGKLYIFQSDGDGTFTETTQTITTPNPIAYAFGGDFTGDGKSDFILANATVYTYVNQGSMPDLLTQVSTGLGATTTISYAPLTNSSVFTKGSAATYPIESYIGSPYVVSQVVASNGLSGGTFSSTYKYAGAKVDLSGRGFLGYASMTVTDSQTNIAQTTNYSQAFPYIGLTLSQSQILSPATLNSTTNTFQFSNASGEATVSNPSVTSAPYFTSLQQSVRTSQDLDGSALPTVTTTNTYEPYSTSTSLCCGNPLTITVSTPDGATKTTTNTYSDNFISAWLLGRLTGSTVTSTTP